MGPFFSFLKRGPTQVLMGKNGLEAKIEKNKEEFFWERPKRFPWSWKQKDLKTISFFALF